MPLEIRFSRRAVSDLEAIHSWLSHKASPNVAVDQFTRISAVLQQLRNFPEIGPAEAGALRRKHIAQSPYLIFYRVERGRIFIVRIRHNREDWRRS